MGRLKRAGKVLLAVVAALLVASWLCANGAWAQGRPKEPVHGVPGDVGGTAPQPDQVQPSGGGTFIDDLVAAPLNLIFRAMKGLGMVEIRELVFGGSEVGGIFTREQWGVVEGFRARFKVVAWLLLVLSVLITGVRVAFSGGKPAQRAGLAQFALDLFIAALLIEFMPMAFDLICDLNRGLVGLVADHVSGAGAWNML
ncbi:MAG: hypothetical protein AB1609_23040, partial [Bacillota bacterium]